MDGTLIKPKEMIETGLLQEINRNFFHVLGLSLVCDDDCNGEKYIVGAVDCRNVYGGLIFSYRSSDFGQIDGISKIADTLEILDAHQVREHGYIQEVNRLLLHPLGMALVIEGAEIAGVLKYDNVEYGIRFKEDDVAIPYAFIDNAQFIVNETIQRMDERIKHFGYWHQPAPKPISMPVDVSIDEALDVGKFNENIEAFSKNCMDFAKLQDNVKPKRIAEYGYYIQPILGVDDPDTIRSKAKQ